MKNSFDNCDEAELHRSCDFT